MKSNYFYIVPLFLFIVLFSFGGSVLAVERDLLIDSVSFEPAQPVVGQTTKIIVNARYYGTNSLTINNGVNNVAFSHSDFVQLENSSNGSSVKPSSYNPLYSGAKFTYTFTGRFTNEGEKMLVFKIDGYDQLLEYNEYNNIKNTTVNVLKTGDLIRLATDSAIYQIGDDGKKHLYVNAPTFWSHYYGTWEELKFNGTRVYVKTITQSVFDLISTGNNMVVKSGSKLVKFQNSPKIYIVFDKAKIKNITEQSALNLFGYNWRNSLITIQNGFESNYTRADSDFKDTDNDGLADEDEVRIYHSDPYTADIDRDGYNDGVEVFGGYDPNSPGRLYY